MSNVLIYLIFLNAFFGNLLKHYSLIPPAAILISEISIYVLFVISILSKSKKSFDLWYVYSFLILIALCSAIMNDSLNMRVLIGLRRILRFYVFYLAVINLGFTEPKFKKLNVLLFILFILQLPASLIRFLFYGISELTIGTYAGHGGGLTPIIPTVALGYLSGFYVFLKPRIIYIILGIGFILFGIAGEKRVLFFLYPVALLGIYYLAYIKGNRISLIKKIAVANIVVIVIVIIQIFMMINIKELNPEYKYGSAKVDFGHVFKFAKEYETAITSRGGGGGRFSTILITLHTLSEAGLVQTMLGLGPGSMSGSVLDKRKYIDKRAIKYSISYGKTGMTHMLMEFGLLGLILVCYVFIAFMVRSLRWFNMETDPYWKAISMGTVVFTFLQTFIFCFYNMSPIFSDTIVPVYFWAMALMYQRKQRLI